MSTVDEQNQNQDDSALNDGDQLDKDDAALWAEMDQAEAAATDDDPDNTGDESAAAADDQGSDDDSAATQQTASDDAAADGGQSDGKQPSDDANKAQDDIWANATPEQRAAFEAAQAQATKLEQAERSNRGRLSALQRQINDLTATKAAPKDAAGKAGEDMTDEEWNEFVDQYPEIAAPVEKRYGARERRYEERITRLEKELSAIGTERRQSALEEQATLLTEQHADWADWAAKPEFGDWLATQPRHIREAAVRNAEEIVDAEEAADVVGRFKEFMGDSTAQQDTGAHADTGGGTDTNNRLAGKRQRQLESASSSRSRGPSVASGIPEDGDPDVIWKQFDEMERRQARA